ncbi:MAG: CarD family transcriptional regulator [Candidatus Pacebacteria bacterium]|nr:CarD family transcriptional regulator [Candidatus Paceibacterota bacterium]
MNLSSNLDKILICSIIPYFLEKENSWTEENLGKILEARKTQSFFEDNILYLEKDQKYNLSQLLRQLDEMGYEKVLEVADPGEFSQRGGVIDVFPLNLSHAVRFDFLGNRIENIEKLPIEIEDEKKNKEFLKKKLKSQKIYSDLKGLKPGDYLVHLDHGIGKFSSIEKVFFPELKFKSPSQSQTEKEYYVLDYAEGDKLYVPLGLERKLSRYVGFIEPKISRLGSLLWQKTKKKIREEAEKFARELLEIYAKREIAHRPPYLADSEIEKQVASTFPYEETPDQIKALEEINHDLENDEPMDRIVCGDVGFGKTEIALRTIVKAVRSGYQTAMICPTTILASQHFQNFKARLDSLPVRLAILSRIQSEKEQKEIIENLKSGKIDIVVGTHRILSNDVEFKNLGLLVIDDEQRFGVKQKEKLKTLRVSLDILSLSATPIPRTMYLAMSSLKAISLIHIPPAGRMAIKTEIRPWSTKTVKEAIENELARGGQVYYLYNKVETISIVKNNLEKLVPEARISYAHGRMREKELIKVMENFQNKKIDVLVATTIIENGIDLPNVNTLIVAESTKLGLSQAYQLRGRVGRSNTQGFAFFLHSNKMKDKAKLRLKALKEAEELGSGYRIALRDLEIRGAGNILGKEQAGSVNRVGLNLYCQMLTEAIEKLKNTAIV